MTHSEIIDEKRRLDKIRRDKIQEVTNAHFETYKEEYARLTEACSVLGHAWKFTNFGPLGDPWYSCGACGKTEIRVVEDP